MFPEEHREAACCGLIDSNLLEPDGHGREQAGGLTGKGLSEGLLFPLLTGKEGMGVARAEFFWTQPG